MKRKLLFVCAALLGMSAWAQTDVTSQYLTNADFDESSAWTTSDVSANKTVNLDGTNWTFNGGSDWYYVATYGINSGKRHNGATVPTTNAAGAATGGVLGLSIGWGNTASVKSSEIMLPAGTYKIEYAAYNGGSATQATNMIGFNTGSKTYYASTSNFKLNEWITDEVSFELTEETIGTINVGIKAVSGGSGSNAKLFIDYVKIYKTKSILEQNTEAVAGASATSPVATNFVVNGTFDNNKDGWTSTTGFQNNGLASNQTGAFTGKFWENWNPSAKTGKMYQTVNNIPNGTYKLKICAFVNNLNSEAQYVYANSDKEYLTAGEPSAYEVWTVVTNNTVEVGLEQTAETADWMGIDNVSLTYYGEGDVIATAKAAEGLDLTAWNEAKTAAETALSENNNTKYAVSEREAVNAKKGVKTPTTIAERNTAVNELNAAVETFKSAYAKDKLQDDMSEYVSNYKTMIAKYTESLETTFSGNCGTGKGQHWNGDSEKSYYDNWNWAATTLTNTCTITLPAGEYALRAAGRRAIEGTSTFVSAKVGESDAITYNGYSVQGDNGLGIDTEGNASYDWRNGTFCNSNNGRGWQWGYVEFTLTEESSVTLSYGYSLAGNTWASIGDAELLCTPATKTAAEVATAKASLKNALDAKPALTANAYGTGAFQFTAADATEYNKVINDAKDVYENSTATLAQVNEQIEKLKALSLPTALNAPSATQAYKIILKFTGEMDKDYFNDFAITTRANDRTDQGYYNLKYAAQNDNYAQAMYFKKLDGTNTYAVWFTDADGESRYICTKKAYGETNKSNFNSIRTTTTEADALPIKVERVGEVLRLYNTENEAYIGAQDHGVYTCGSHNDYVVVETTAENGISKTVAAGKYATVVLPYAATITSGKAYTATVEDDLVKLEETTSLEANKAYILGEGTYNFSGVNVAFAAPAANGVLTGVFDETQVPVGSYVMQTTTEGDQKFFKVEEGSQPTLSANKAYLTVSSSEASLRISLDDEATAINSVISALTSDNVQIYDINGRKLQSLQKGINIVNGKKVLVK